ncbi:hypothetical protein HYW74_03330 [Candidatus Pacearchaeota archaeon]|nr:hypothetical protein [Candidatus Pacearchaeota archaeon]
MKIIIDSNRVIAALIKDSTTRAILFNKTFQFFAPSYIKSEIAKYKQEIINKAGINSKEFDALISMIFECITIIPQEKYSSIIDKVKDKTSDVNDFPYFAVCLLINAGGIWTHDPHFYKQNNYKIFTNMDMLRIIEEGGEKGE